MRERANWVWDEREPYRGCAETQKLKTKESLYRWWEKGEIVQAKALFFFKFHTQRRRLKQKTSLRLNDLKMPIIIYRGLEGLKRKGKGGGGPFPSGRFVEVQVVSISVRQRLIARACVHLCKAEADSEGGEAGGACGVVLHAVVPRMINDKWIFILLLLYYYINTRCVYFDKVLYDVYISIYFDALYCLQQFRINNIIEDWKAVIVNLIFCTKQQRNVFVVSYSWKCNTYTILINY